MFIERDFEQVAYSYDLMVFKYITDSDTLEQVLSPGYFDEVFDESCDGAIIHIEAAGKYGLYKIRKKPGRQYYLIEA